MLYIRCTHSAWGGIQGGVKIGAHVVGVVKFLAIVMSLESCPLGGVGSMSKYLLTGLW